MGAADPFRRVTRRHRSPDARLAWKFDALCQTPRSPLRKGLNFRLPRVGGRIPAGLLGYAWERDNPAVNTRSRQEGGRGGRRRRSDT